MSDLILNSIITVIVSMALISIFVVYYVSIITKNLRFMISEMKKINSDSDISFKTLPITSTDEIGVLSKEFNAIENKIILYIDQIKSSQNMLIKKDSLTSLGQLAGGIAHDLNTPLGAIDANIIIMKDIIGELKDKDITDDIRKDLIDIEARINKLETIKEKMSNIVNSVRNHMRNISGEENKLFCPIDCINNMKTIINHQLIKNNCDLEIVNIPNIEILGDSTKFEQVLTNLVINAIQAYQGKPGKIRVYGDIKENNLILCVEDKAGGIPKQIQDGIFQNILTTKGVEGTGLGLYLVSSIITGHFNGKIDFKVDEGVGTIFIIKIPIVKN